MKQENKLCENYILPLVRFATSWTTLCCSTSPPTKSFWRKSHHTNSSLPLLLVSASRSPGPWLVVLLMSSRPKVGVYYALRWWLSVTLEGRLIKHKRVDTSYLNEPKNYWQVCSILTKAVCLVSLMIKGSSVSFPGPRTDGGFLLQDWSARWSNIMHRWYIPEPQNLKIRLIKMDD